MPEQQASCFHLHRRGAIGNRSDFWSARIQRKKSCGEARYPAL